MQAWWKNPKIIGNSAYVVMRGLAASTRIKVAKHDSINFSKPYLYSFWHGDQFLPALTLSKIVHTPQCVLVSPSRDGSILAVFLQNCGYEVLRGSSRDHNVRALVALKNKVRDGFSIGFGIDGPIGPIHVVKPGIAFLSQKYNLPIIPVGCAFSRYWTFQKAWDKFQLPKPFASAAMFLAEPYTVSEAENIDAACIELKRRMFEAAEQARRIILPDYT